MLFELYPWVKALHIISMVAWMVGLFYLPRLFVYHTERSEPGDAMDDVFQTMEEKLLRIIMNPAMLVTWVCGLILVSTPGLVDWGAVWPYIKLVCVVALTGFHMWLAKERKIFARGERPRSGRTWRLLNEVPTIFMILAIGAVIVRPF